MGLACRWLATLVVLGAVASATPAWGITDPTAPITTMQVLPKHCVGQDGTMPAVARSCRITRYADRPTVVVWGDSHSWQQIPALKSQARDTHTNLVAFQMGACPPMLLSGTRYRGECAQVGELALAFIKHKVKQGQQVTVVLGAFWQLYRDLSDRLSQGWVPEPGHDAFLAEQAKMFALGGPRVFRALDRLHLRTAAILQMPWVVPDAPACGAGMEPYACDLSRKVAITDEIKTDNWLEPKTDFFIDTTGYVCDKTICRASTGGRPTFLDDLHLNPRITGAFAPAYSKVFRS